MTTRQQRFLYFPAWRRALAAGWAKRDGVLFPRPALQPAQRDLVEQIHTQASSHVARQYRGVDADDLRHAAHVVAIGRDKSSAQLTNAETDRVLALCRVIANPDDIQAILDWENRSGPDRRRLLWVIEHGPAPEAYVQTVANGKFGTADLRKLSTPQLLMLATTLSARYRAKRQEEAVPQPAGDVDDNEPF